MTDQAQNDDRRINRSNNRTMAVHYLLQKVADDFGLESFAVASGDEAEVIEQSDVQAFQAEGEALYLKVTGEPGTMRELGVVRAIMGIRRIWRETGAELAA